MKKILLIPAVIGLVAVPSFVVAHRGADENKPNDSSQEDRKDDSSSKPESSSNDSSSLDDSPDSSDDNSNSQPATGSPSSSSSVTLDQAKTIALGVFPDKTIKKVETELEHGVLIYSVRFTDSSRVDVNSSNGSVVRTEQEDDDHIEDSGDDSHDDSPDKDEDDS